MMNNPVFRRCYEIRCLEWFHTIQITDEHVVPDNVLPNERRLGSFINAQATFKGDRPVPLGGLAAAPKAPGVSRPFSPAAPQRKARRVVPTPGAGYSTGSRVSSSQSSWYPDENHQRGTAPCSSATPIFQSRQSSWGMADHSN
eukprot:1050950-Heterocapsa_arctica.AAC.1